MTIGTVDYPLSAVAPCQLLVEIVRLCIVCFAICDLIYPARKRMALHYYKAFTAIETVTTASFGRCLQSRNCKDLGSALLWMEPF